MNIDKFGKVIISSSELFESLYCNKIQSFDNIFINDNDINLYNESVKNTGEDFPCIKYYVEENEDIDLFDESNRCNWFLPKEYNEFPIEEWLYEQCKTQEEKDRVYIELKKYIEYNVFDVLFYLKYLVDTMRLNKIVWGVGRGSSTASYILYLIGVHKINSIKYNLDIEEFLK